jgi:hypothetical protein
MSTLAGMKWLKTMAIFGLLGLWLGAANHCKLEEIPGLRFLICCDHDGAAPHQDGDCDTDGCAQVEEGLYKTEDCRVAAHAPLLLLEIPRAEIACEEVASVQVSWGDFLTVALPELPVTWQFSFRTALPPRAPSFAS